MEKQALAVREQQWYQTITAANQRSSKLHKKIEEEEKAISIIRITF